MTSIVLNNVSLSFPIYGVNALSFKNNLISLLSANIISNNNNNIITVKALSDISISIKKGERVGLIGSNGSGKTSLLKLLTGIFYPTTGSINISGEIRSIIDLSFGIDPEATGRENIKFRLLMLGYSDAQIKEMEPIIIKSSGIDSFIDLPTQVYSSGMNIRLAFAMSVIGKGDITIMDEWLSVGDMTFMKFAEKQLNFIVNESQILIIASHDFNIIKKLCNRCILLDKGKVIVDSTPEIAINYYVENF